MREIVTIQVGEFANFVGSHFWNFQVREAKPPVELSAPILLTMDSGFCLSLFFITKVFVFFAINRLGLLKLRTFT
jgi:hypothetical protein